jgi:hypothetical protein
VATLLTPYHGGSYCAMPRQHLYLTKRPLIIKSSIQAKCLPQVRNSVSLEEQLLSTAMAPRSASASASVSESARRSPSRLAISHTPHLAQKVLQMSYMELIHEHARPEPRLRRLIGHVFAYESALRWNRDGTMEGAFDLSDSEGGDEASADDGYECRPYNISSDESQRVQPFSEPQATTRSWIDMQQAYTVTATEITEDGSESEGSQESQESQRSDTYEVDNEDLVDEMAVGMAHPVIEPIELVRNSVLLKPNEDFVAKMSRCTIITGREQADGRRPTAAPSNWYR